ncbi:MAG TPA: thioredoxin family protein [Terriglobales bacterium]|nr:thioredoxin family protein [Terriglobales bacterium]
MAKRKVEVFSAGCGVCDKAVQLVRSIACSSCDISVLDMKEPKVAERAMALGVRSVPAIAVDGMLADCCSGRGPDESTLRSAGIGQPL